MIQWLWLRRVIALTGSVRSHRFVKWRASAVLSFCYRAGVAKHALSDACLFKRCLVGTQIATVCF